MEKVPSRIKSQVGSVDIAVIMRGRDEEEGEIYRTQRKCDNDVDTGEHKDAKIALAGHRAVAPEELVDLSVVAIEDCYHFG